MPNMTVGIHTNESSKEHVIFTNIVSVTILILNEYTEMYVKIKCFLCVQYSHLIKYQYIL